MKPFVLWRGTSPLATNEPIVALVTWESANTKTGNMAQVYILHENVHPFAAVQSGDDVAVCGHCPMRGESSRGRACYVRVEQGPSNLWKKYQRYIDSGKDLTKVMVTPDMFEGKMIRWGAYGDPAVLPAYLVEACNDKARGWTGYTHQYKYKWAQWAKGVFMASVETPKQEETLFEKGWGTFRAGLKDSSDKGSATLCLNEKTGITCLECKVCDGRHKRIFIPSHGRGADMVPAEKLLRRKDK